MSIVHEDEAKQHICPIMTGGWLNDMPRCQGIRCMAWRKAGIHSKLGYCGLSGVPSYGWEDRPPTQLENLPPPAKRV